MNTFIIITWILFLWLVVRRFNNQYHEFIFRNKINDLKQRFRIFVLESKYERDDMINFVNLIFDNATKEAYSLTIFNLLLKYRHIHRDGDLENIIQYFENEIEQDENLRRFKNEFDDHLVNYLKRQHSITSYIIDFVVLFIKSLQVQKLRRDLFLISIGPNGYNTMKAHDYPEFKLS